MLTKLMQFASQSVYVSFAVGSGPFDHRVLKAVGREANSNPDYIYVYNLLYQQGIYANVALVEKRAHTFANEEEAKVFTGKAPEKALDDIAAMCNIAVVKIGKNGSLIKQGNDIYRVGAIPASVIDTTGAGDLFAAGFLYGHVKGLSLDKCGHIGALLAGKVIEVMGAKINDSIWDNIKSGVKKIEID